MSERDLVAALEAAFAKHDPEEWGSGPLADFIEPRGGGRRMKPVTIPLHDGRVLRLRIVPKRRPVCRGGHAAWGGPGPWICNNCGKDVRTGKVPA